MSQVRLIAEPRSDFGKGAARRLRRAGQGPAVIYGDGELLHVALPGHALTLALTKPRIVLEVEFGGKVTLTKPRDIQRDVVSRQLEHVDLIVVTKAEAGDRAAEAVVIADAEAVAEAEGNAF